MDICKYDTNLKQINLNHIKFLKDRFPIKILTSKYKWECCEYSAKKKEREKVHNKTKHMSVQYDDRVTCSQSAKRTEPFRAQIY
jgi:hypothetical protein